MSRVRAWAEELCTESDKQEWGDIWKALDPISGIKSTHWCFCRLRCISRSIFSPIISRPCSLLLSSLMLGATNTRVKIPRFHIPEKLQVRLDRHARSPTPATTKFLADIVFVIIIIVLLLGAPLTQPFCLLSDYHVEHRARH